jgi:hypothetical protein
MTRGGSASALAQHAAHDVSGKSPRHQEAHLARLF